MVRYRFAGLVALLVLVVSAWGAVSMAQEEGGRGRGRRGRFDPQMMRQRMMERLQESLGATDEEWEVIGPRLEKVMTLSRQTRAGGLGALFGGRFRGRGRRPGQGQQEEPSPVAKAASELQETIEDTDASPDAVREQLTEYRAAREKARQELEKARDELREVLSIRQEARLVLMGTLE